MLKKIFIVSSLALLMSCSSGLSNEEPTTGNNKYSGNLEKIETTDGHVRIFWWSLTSENSGVMEDPECPRCKARLVETIDSILDSRGL